MDKGAKIFIAGHNGIAGSALVAALRERGFSNLVLKTRKQLDLVDQSAVAEFFTRERPEYVFMCAVLPCGAANVAQRADFIYENTMMQNNIIHQSWRAGVRKLICYGSGYMYPERFSKPLREDLLFCGELEWGAYSFGVAKIACAAMCESYNIQYGTDFFCLAPNNLYGTQANFTLGKSRVLPALLRKFHLARLLECGEYDAVVADLALDVGVSDIKQARAYLSEFGVSEKSVEVWGSGKVLREFLHASDLADASIFVAENLRFSDLTQGQKQPRNTHINIGTNKGYSIAQVAEMVRSIVGFSGQIVFNTSRPDSSMDRIMDCSKIHALGWRHSVELEDGIKMMYRGYVSR